MQRTSGRPNSTGFCERISTLLDCSKAHCLCHWIFTCWGHSHVSMMSDWIFSFAYNSVCDVFSNSFLFVFFHVFLHRNLIWSLRRNRWRMWKCVVQDAHPRCSLTEEREGKMHTVQSMKGPSPSQEEKSWRLEIRWGVNSFFSRRSWRHQSPTPMFEQGIFSQGANNSRVTVNHLYECCDE